MSTVQIFLEHPPALPDRDVVEEGLMAYLAARVGDPHLDVFGCLLRDPGHRLQGGLLGRLWWRWLYIERLWIAPPLRQQGYGRRLLHAAEAHAVAADCLGAFVDTFDPLAVAFYQHHGYQIVCSLPDFPPG